MNLMKRRIYKKLEDNIHINKLIYFLNNKNNMEYLINNFINYNDNYYSDNQIKKLYKNFMN